MKAYASVEASGTAELLERARMGEREAFTQLVEHHHAELVRIAYAITTDLEAARDAAQMAWIKAWQRLPTVREPHRLRAWLIAIAANEARQHTRARRRREVREIAPLREDEEDRQGEGRIDQVEASTIPSAARLDLRTALVSLPPADRQFLALRYLAGLNADEIGVEMRMTSSGVRTRLARVLARLRQELDHD